MTGPQDHELDSSGRYRRALQ